MTKLVVITADADDFPEPRDSWPRAEIISLLVDQLHAVLDQLQEDQMAELACLFMVTHLTRDLPVSDAPVSRTEVAGLLARIIGGLLTLGEPEGPPQGAVVACGLAAVRFSLLLFGPDVGAEESRQERGEFLAACRMEMGVSTTIDLGDSPSHSLH